jgi:tyrosyl-DNA phosphodiesterase-1
VINVDESDSDEEFQAQLRAAIEASKTDPPNIAITETAVEDRSSKETSTFLSERAGLEKERLERQKRRRPQALQTNGDGDGDGDGDGGEDDADRSSVKRHFANSKPVAGPSHASISDEVDELFWDGALRPIANMHANPRKDGQPTFRLTEVLGKVCLIL